MKVRLTQKNLLLGIYRGPKDSINPGLSIWFSGRYIWPWKRSHGKRADKALNLPFDKAPHMVIELDDTRPSGTLKEEGELSA